jgi:hypothetical protein
MYAFVGGYFVLFVGFLLVACTTECMLPHKSAILKGTYILYSPGCLSASIGNRSRS